MFHNSGAAFGRMFETLGVADDQALIELAGRVTRATRQTGDNTTIPAGYTYLGQFVDHDITFDSGTVANPRLKHDDPTTVNFRTARFDLDSLYGRGPQESPELFEADGVRLRVGRDLPRDEGKAIIADPRNDENVIVAQLHLLFACFHNRQVLEHGADFEAARKSVCWHYQWVVLHDLLPRIVGADTARAVFDDTCPQPTDRRIFPESKDEPREIPVEFVAAAYRFGHSMVREDYTLRRGGGAVPVFSNRRRDGETLAGGRPIPPALEIEWDQFFELSSRTPQLSRLIDTSLADELDAVPGGHRLPLLNLRSARRHGLPSGQAVARAVARVLPGVRPLTESELRRGLGPLADGPLLRDLSLWYYVLLEAQLRCNGGEHLGPVGGRIVAEVLVGLVEDDPESYLSQGWSPPSGRDFDMPALIRAATA